MHLHVDRPTLNGGIGNIKSVHGKERLAVVFLGEDLATEEIAHAQWQGLATAWAMKNLDRSSCTSACRLLSSIMSETFSTVWARLLWPSCIKVLLA
jgi:hypothetical protein